MLHNVRKTETIGLVRLKLEFSSPCNHVSQTKNVLNRIYQKGGLTQPNNAVES